MRFLKKKLLVFYASLLWLVIGAQSAHAFNWGDLAAGMTIGAVVGSVFPGPGTVIGALVGLVVGAFKNASSLLLWVGLQIMTVVAGVVGWVLNALTGLMFSIANALIGYAILLNEQVFTNPLTQRGHEVFLVLGNLGLVVVIVVIAFAIMTRAEWLIETRKALPKFIAAAIMINFSFFIGKTIFNPVNQLTEDIYDASMANPYTFFNTFRPTDIKVSELSGLLGINIADISPADLYRPDINQVVTDALDPVIRREEQRVFDALRARANTAGQSIPDYLQSQGVDTYGLELGIRCFEEGRHSVETDCLRSFGDRQEITLAARLAFDEATLGRIYNLPQLNINGTAGFQSFDAIEAPYTYGAPYAYYEPDANGDEVADDWDRLLESSMILMYHRAFKNDPFLGDVMRRAIGDDTCSSGSPGLGSGGYHRGDSNNISGDDLSDWNNNVGQIENPVGDDPGGCPNFLRGLHANAETVITSPTYGGCAIGQIVNCSDRLLLWDPTKIVGGAFEDEDQLVILKIAALFVEVIFWFLFTGIGVFSLLLTAAMFFIRFVSMSLLVIVFPITWIAWVFPKIGAGEENIWTKWWEQFLRWLIFGPIAMFFFWLTAYGAVNIQNVSPAGAIAPDAPGLVKLAAATGNLVLIVGFLIGGLYIANKMSLTGSKKLYGMAKGAALGATKAYVKGIPDFARGVAILPRGIARGVNRAIKGGPFLPPVGSSTPPKTTTTTTTITRTGPVMTPQPPQPGPAVWPPQPGPAAQPPQPPQPPATATTTTTIVKTAVTAPAKPTRPTPRTAVGRRWAAVRDWSEQHIDSASPSERLGAIKSSRGNLIFQTWAGAKAGAKIKDDKKDDGGGDKKKK